MPAASSSRRRCRPCSRSRSIRTRWDCSGRSRGCTARSGAWRRSKARCPARCMPAGCRFAERCPFADAQCRSASPPLRELGGGRRSACWKAPLDADALVARPLRVSAGSMLNTAKNYVDNAPWMAIWPGVSIFLLVLGFNLLGDGLRDALDPREGRGRRRRHGCAPPAWRPAAGRRRLSTTHRVKPARVRCRPLRPRNSSPAA